MKRDELDETGRSRKNNNIYYFRCIEFALVVSALTFLLLIRSLMSSYSTQAIDDNSQCTINIQHTINSIATFNML